VSLGLGQGIQGTPAHPPPGCIHHYALEKQKNTSEVALSVILKRLGWGVHQAVDTGGGGIALRVTPRGAAPSLL